MRRNAFLLCLILFVQGLSAQAPRVDKIEPPNWWTGMKLNKIQLMVYGEHLDGVQTTSFSRDITILKTYSPPNHSYAFINIEIKKTANPGIQTLKLSSRMGSTSFRFPLLKRPKAVAEHQGFNSSDVIYLIVPDRFANGDTTNDNIAGMLDGVKRSDPSGRHGGDLQGIITKLDYLNDLRVTTLWLTPVVENNTPRGSYHGYATTNLYEVDSRLGSNDLYREFVREAHQHKLKVIMDHVNNHISINHPWIKNLPTPDWLNGTPENHQRPTNSKAELDDMHSDSLIKQRETNGWFDDHMPDLNQRNPFVSQYLKQSTIWWIEFSGIDGIREDTYPYIDPRFREDWCKTVLEEYPRFNIVGEVWVQDPVFLAPYQRGSHFRRSIKPELPSLTDFGLYDALLKTFADTSGKIENVFTTLAKDFLYPDPENLVTFLDNHDIRRIMFNVKGDVKRFKLALLTLLTTRGIPEMLYGTEIGMKGGPDHGTLRADFPGGFTNDQRNAFSESGRSEEENEIFNFTRQLLKIRSTYKSLQKGSLIHFKPKNEVYVYFRILGNERVMVVINHNIGKQRVDLLPFANQLQGGMWLRNLITGTELELSGTDKLELEGMSGMILEIVRPSKL
ncbi:MAG: alpha-amylase family glycosyl hydrolase [Bacteroidota bacterium]